VRISAAIPVFIGRDGSHRDVKRDGGPDKMALRNFVAQVRQQGAAFRRDATSHRSVVDDVGGEEV